MNKRVLLSALVLSVFVLAACGRETVLLEDGVTPAAPQAGIAPVNAPYDVDDLTLQAFAPDRQVAPAADEVFDLTIANHTGTDLPVVVSLEQVEGSRWRTSLCVQRQCILGDGIERSVTDPFVLPPFLEQPFQVHLFVDEAAQHGERMTLQVRVEPQVDGIESRTVVLNAVVAAP